ncbi:hypothetical protein D3C86_1071710 [compost metagenome]
MDELDAGVTGGVVLVPALRVERLGFLVQALGGRPHLLPRAAQLGVGRAAVFLGEAQRGVVHPGVHLILPAPLRVDAVEGAV